MKEDTKPNLIAAIICVGAFFLWLNLLIEKFVHFGYYDWDLAMYAQAVWALSQGSLTSSIFQTSFLTNHAEYIAFFLAPFYKIFPSAFTLIVFKILSFTAGSFVFYLIVKKLLGWKMGLFFLVLYLLHPANLFMLIYEFHFENLAIVFIFLMYYFFLEQKLVPFLISVFFATLIKENISLVVFMFSLYAFFKKEPKGKGWILGPIILGLGVFILTMFLITPWLRHAEGITSGNGYVHLYNNLWQNFSSPLNQQYILELFGPFHILTFLSPLTLSIGAPIFLQHFLAGSFTMHTIHYHYAATAIIFIFLSVAETFRRLQPKVSVRTYTFIILLLIATYGLFLKTHLPEFIRRTQMWADRLDPIRREMLSKIPPTASVVATFDFLDKLSMRKDVYTFHNVWQDIAGFAGKSPFILPDVFYALIDWDSPWLWGDLFGTKTETNVYLHRLHRFYFSRDWHVIQAVEDITLLSRAANSLSIKLVENSTQSFGNSKNAIEVGESLQLLSLKLADIPQTDRNILPLEFIWKAKTRPTKFLASNIRIFQNDKVVTQRQHPIGYNFNATPLWEEGQFVREHYFLLLPDLAPGEYQVNISVFDLKTNRFETLISQGNPGNNFNVFQFKITGDKT